MWTKLLSGAVVVIFLAIAGLLLLSRFSVPGLNFQVLVVQSGSMEPAIKTGSVVFVTPNNLYVEGDIITFRRGLSRLEVPITHRIAAVEVIEGELVYTVKGDANEYADTEKVLAGEVLGKVKFHIPYLGILIDSAKTPLGFVGLIILPALLIIGDEVRKIWHEIKRRKEQNLWH